MTPQDPASHRDPQAEEGPLDVAHQSLADALRASFRILKGIMMVLVVLYLFSNVRRVDSHEQALQLRLGRLQPNVHEAGLVWAFPFPIDEIVPLPTRKSNELPIDSHTFHRSKNEIGKSLAFIARGPTQGLRPDLDGALMTADAGLVHMRWKVTYKFDDVAKYVSQILGREVEAAEALIRTLVENAGILIASSLTAEEMIRTRVKYVQQEMRRRINEQLERLGSGVTVTVIEMYEPTPPIPVRKAFDDTQRAESSKRTKIRDAEQAQSNILNKVAGAAHARVLKVIDVIDDPTADPAQRAAANAELDRLLEQEVEGTAGRILKDAGAYLSTVVGRMKSDVALYRTLLPEYKRNPSLLVARLLEQTRQQILNYPDVTKVFRPSKSEFRIILSLDPEQTRIEEERRLQEKEFDPSKLRPNRIVPVGPEYD